MTRAGGEELVTLPASGPVRKLACSPDATRLAVVVDGECVVWLWRLDRLARRLAALDLTLDIAALEHAPAGSTPSWLGLQPVPMAPELARAQG